MKTSFKSFKSVVSISILGALLAVGACAEKTVRSEGEAMLPLEQAVELASTPAEHEAVAARYEEEAERLRKLARRHERLAKTYAMTDNPKIAGDSARHCRNIVRQLQQAAEEMQSLARMHRQNAGQWE
ncbi:MAG: hypothetical protein Kow0060_23690 [Methylohalobius crimeensis]